MHFFFLILNYLFNMLISFLKMHFISLIDYFLLSLLLIEVIICLITFKFSSNFRKSIFLINITFKEIYIIYTLF